MNTLTRPMTLAQVEAGIRHIEARPVAARARTLRYLSWATPTGSAAERAVEEVVLWAIPEAESLPEIVERARTLRYLSWATPTGSAARRAVEEAIIRAIPEAEAASIAERERTFRYLLWATRDGSDARRAVEEAMVRNGLV